MMLRVLVVDDEPAARRRLCRLLRQEPNILIEAECADGDSAMRAITDLAPDVVFLDIHLSDTNGFHTLEQLPRTRRPAIVFVTAYAEYAVRAFDVDAVDYLLKPFDRGRLREALTRVVQRLHSPHPTSCERGDGPACHQTRLIAKRGGRTVMLQTDAILWIKASDKVVRLHTHAGVFELREALSQVEKRLDPDKFARIHRSTIVNLDRISELQPAFHGDLCVVMTDGTPLTLSRTYRSRISERLGQRV